MSVERIERIRCQSCPHLGCCFFLGLDDGLLRRLDLGIDDGHCSMPWGVNSKSIRREIG